MLGFGSSTAAWRREVWRKERDLVLCKTSQVFLCKARRPTALKAVLFILLCTVSHLWGHSCVLLISSAGWRDSHVEVHPCHMRVSAKEVSAQVHTWLPGSVYYLGIRVVCIFSQNSSGTAILKFTWIFFSAAWFSSWLWQLRSKEGGRGANIFGMRWGEVERKHPSVYVYTYFTHV